MDDDRPRRIADDPDADPELKALLASALAVPAPPIAVSSGLASFEARLQDTPVAEAPPTGTAAAGPVPWLAIVGVAVAAAAALAWWLSRAPTAEGPAPEPAPAPAVAHASEPPGADPLGHADPAGAPRGAPGQADARDRPPDPVDRTRPEPSPEPVALPVTPAPNPVTSPRAGRKPRESPAPPSVREEIEAMAKIRVLLESDPKRALSKIAAASKRFGAGVFGEERAALRVLAHDAIGHDARAARLGRAFLAAHPNSTLAPRVRAALRPAAPPP